MNFSQIQSLTINSQNVVRLLLGSQVVWRKEESPEKTVVYYTDGTRTTLDVSGQIQAGDVPDVDSAVRMRIGNTVTTIPDYAFNECTSLEKVEGSAVTTIGGYAFSKCSNLNTVDFPALQSLNVGSYRAFQHTNLESVNFPNLTNMGNATFVGCNALTSFSFGNMTTINPWTFFGCGALEEIDLDNIQQIGNSAFQSCHNLRTVNAQDCIKLYGSVFADCENLDTVNFGAGTCEIGQGSFSNSNLSNLKLNFTGRTKDEVEVIGFCPWGLDKSNISFDAEPVVQKRTYKQLQQHIRDTLGDQTAYVLLYIQPKDNTSSYYDITTSLGYSLNANIKFEIGVDVDTTQKNAIIGTPFYNGNKTAFAPGIGFENGKIFGQNTYNGYWNNQLTCENGYNKFVCNIGQQKFDVEINGTKYSKTDVASITAAAYSPLTLFRMRDWYTSAINKSKIYYVKAVKPEGHTAGTDHINLVPIWSNGAKFFDLVSNRVVDIAEGSFTIGVAGGYQFLMQDQIDAWNLKEG